MMGERRYESLLFADLSAITQINRVGPPLEALIRNDEWHSRLLNGSDYPLPGIPPLFSLKQIKRHSYISKAEAETGANTP